jgi:hypothetical protein
MKKLMALKFISKDQYLSSSRRLYPSLQIVYNSLKVSTALNSATFSYQPANCLFNLTDNGFSQNYGVCKNTH